MRYRFAFLLATASTVCTGCRPEDEIAHYRAPKSQPPPASTRPAMPKPGVAKAEGLLGAIVLHGDQGWFFKLTGPVQALVEQGETFRRFVASVRFAGDRPDYDPPAHWQAQGPSEFRYETFVIPRVLGEHSLSLAISHFEKPAGDDVDYLLANINRWRGQMGLDPIEEAQITEFTNRVRLGDGSDAILVAMAAGGSLEKKPGSTAAGKAPQTPARAARPSELAETPDRMLAAYVPHGNDGWFFKLAGPAEAVASRQSTFHEFVESVHFEGDEPRFSPPADWQAQGRLGPRYETFRLPAAGRTLELTVTRLVKPPGAAEDYVLANVNRWRDQMGLAPLDSSALANQTGTLKTTDGDTAVIVDLTGKLKAGPPMVPGK